MHPLTSVAFTVIGKEPVSVGVPESTPVADKLIPAGSVPVKLQVMGACPPVWVN